MPAGPSIFIGPNGQGKTNLIEAVDYVATLSSHRVSSDAPLVHQGSEHANIGARVRAGLDDQRTAQVQIQINPGRPNSITLNRNPIRSKDLIGLLRTVVFAPDDLAIVKGDPAQRRQFIDQLIISRWPRLLGVKSDYDKVLRQRSALLKTMSGSRSRHQSTNSAGDSDVTLEIWTDQLITLGSELVKARLDTLIALEPFLAAAYGRIAPTNNEAKLAYTSATGISMGHSTDDIRELLASAAAQRRSDEIRRGVTLVGPHRDDIEFSLGTLPVKGYASHGESWSYALSLRLGAFELLTAEDVRPVLILDDVFAELDSTRRQRLAAEATQAEQLLITAAVSEDVPDILAGERFSVAEGQVTRV